MATSTNEAGALNEGSVVPFFWRRVTEDDVRNAISGSFLGTICDAFEKNYIQKRVPLALTIMPGIALMACALTHKKEPSFNMEDEEEEKEPVSFILFGDEEECLSPAKKSGLYINTVRGNVPNAYVLIVAPSAAGKNVVNFSQYIESFGYSEISDGTLEGIKDRAVENPHLLLSLQEFGAILGKGDKKVRTGLTEMFNAGNFKIVMSTRTKKPPRTCEWFFPTIYGAVQPEVLKKEGRELDLAQGLFGRFLIGYISPQEARYDIRPCNKDIGRDDAIIRYGLSCIARLQGVVDVPDEEYNVKFSHPIEDAGIDGKMIPLVKRYANEYLPRIALMLAIPARVDGSLTLPKLTTEHFQRATIILYWLLTMAERALGTLSDLEGRDRLMEQNLWKMARKLKQLTVRKGKITIADISKSSSGTGWDSDAREKILNEMCARDWISIHTPLGLGERVMKGCTITLNEDNLPPGIC